jgi:starch synthase
MRATCSPRTRRRPRPGPRVHNGIDTDAVPPTDGTDAERSASIPTSPAWSSSAGSPRQKGLPYLLRAARTLPPAQLVVLAGAPDTPEIAAEVQALADELRATREGVVWVQAMLPKPEVIQVLSQATVFVCPSIYEPMGIVNLEAMACETAVVATATGGIPEVVADGTTGLLVPIEQASDGTGTPTDPDRFVADMAGAIGELLDDPGRAAADGQGRPRARAGAVLVVGHRRAHHRGLPGSHLIPGGRPEASLQ